MTPLEELYQEARKAWRAGFTASLPIAAFLESALGGEGLESLLHPPPRSIDERAVGRHEGLLMACSWLEAMERHALRQRDKWGRADDQEHSRVEGAIARAYRLGIDGLLRKAQEMQATQAFLEDRGHAVGRCPTCGGSGLVPFGLPSDGPVPCPECGPEDAPL